MPPLNKVFALAKLEMALKVAGTTETAKAHGEAETKNTNERLNKTSRLHPNNIDPKSSNKINIPITKLTYTGS